MVVTLSLIDMDRQTQKMGRYIYVEIHERFPHLLPFEGAWEQAITTCYDGTFDKKKDDDGTDGYGNNSKKSSVFLFTFLKNKIVWAEM